MSRLLWTATIVALSGAPAAAILIRHDVADARYRELGEKYPAVSNFGRAGEGTLAAPRWVATAAHVAAGLRRNVTIRFGDSDYAVERVVTHPDWKQMGAHDVAVVRLTAPVAGVQPLPLYTRSDEAGQEVIFVGHGGTGTGTTGTLRQEDGLKRGATNRIDRADGDWLFFTFDAPPAATELEGISGPGDSGGPALILVDGRPHIAGISVWGKPGPGGRGTYGATEGYTRVSTHAAWLMETMRPD